MSNIFNFPFYAKIEFSLSILFDFDKYLLQEKNKYY